MARWARMQYEILSTQAQLCLTNIEQDRTHTQGSISSVSHITICTHHAGQSMTFVWNTSFLTAIDAHNQSALVPTFGV